MVVNTLVDIKHVDFVHVDERHKEQEHGDGLEDERARRMDRGLECALASVEPRAGLAVKVRKSLLVCVSRDEQMSVHDVQRELTNGIQKSSCR